MSLITLLTDFGQQDTYVGQMKGAILAVAPQVRLVDLTHEIPAQNIRAGAFHLAVAVVAFPAGTLHLAVVDPGVGTARRAIAIRTGRGDFLVGPDNGLLSPAAERLGGVRAAVVLDKEQYWGARRSKTFHGRDVFAPVVGHLARGVLLEEVGSPIADLASAVLFPEPTRDGRTIHGQVVHVDRFGNLITNIRAEDLPRHYSTHIRDRTIFGGAGYYQSVPPGQLAALIGSTGLLEIAARDGSAAGVIGADADEPVRVEFEGAGQKSTG